MSNMSSQVCPNCESVQAQGSTVCTNCGKEMPSTSFYSPAGGVSGQTKICPNCKNVLPISALACPGCGMQLFNQNQSAPSPIPGPGAGQVFGSAGSEKNKTVAALLAIFLGGLGIHFFYLGSNKQGYIVLGIFGASLVLSIVGIGLLGGLALSIYGVVQGVMYLSASDADFYQKYVVEQRWF